MEITRDEVPVGKVIAENMCFSSWCYLGYSAILLVVFACLSHYNKLELSVYQARLLFPSMAIITMISTFGLAISYDTGDYTKLLMIKDPNRSEMVFVVLWFLAATIYGILGSSLGDIEDAFTSVFMVCFFLACVIFAGLYMNAVHGYFASLKDHKET